MPVDTAKYKVWTWKHPFVLHFILNPGLAFNELVLGQRVPKVSLVERDKTKSLGERSFVPCPHCQTVHSGMKWSLANRTAFGNWFGLYCDHCGGIIPCVTNLTSLIILALTFPIWYPFKNRWKEKWLQVQREKFSKPLILTEPDFKWWETGLGFGFSMFVFNGLSDFLVFQETFTWRKLAISLVVWTLGGLVFGLLLKKIAGKNKPQQAA